MFGEAHALINNLLFHRDHIDYIENQCSKPLPDCSYTVGSKDVTVIANDDILYSRTVQDCQRFCDDVSLIDFFYKLRKTHIIDWLYEHSTHCYNLTRPEHLTAAVLHKKETDVTWGKFYFRIFHLFMKISSNFDLKWLW